MVQVYCIDCTQHLGTYFGILYSQIEGVRFKDGWRCNACSKKYKDKERVD